MRRTARPRGPRNPFVPKKQVEEPAPRNFNYERLLCTAINKHLRVVLKYELDLRDRLFEPNAVYFSTADQQRVLVTGTQVRNPDDPRGRSVPRNFEVGKISSVGLTEEEFQPDRRFNRFDEKFANGIICSI